MRLVRTLFVVAAGLGLVAAAPSADAAKKAKEHHVKGVVASVDHDKDKGTITLTVKHKDKTTQAVTTDTKTFKVTEATTFVKVSGKKGAETKDPATFADVKEGDNLVVTEKDGTAAEVAIHPKHKKKNA